jgi:hypothetical protein
MPHPAVNCNPQHRAHRSAPSSNHEAIRRRLAVLGWAATHVEPTVWGWCLLHERWRSLDFVHTELPDLAAEHDRVDRLLGGHRRGAR